MMSETQIGVINFKDTEGATKDRWPKQLQEARKWILPARFPERTTPVDILNFAQ